MCTGARLDPDPPFSPADRIESDLRVHTFRAPRQPDARLTGQNINIASSGRLAVIA